MKRYLVALGAAGLVGSVVLGSAAALNVDGGVVQSGQDMDLTCDANGVTVIQRSELDAQVPYSIGPRVTDIAEACEGEWIVVTAFQGATQLGQYTGVILAGTVNGTWDTGDVDLADIENLTVTLLS